MIGSSKVALQGEVLLENLVVMELGAVVKGDGPEITPVLLDRGKGRLGHGRSSSRAHLADDHEARFSFHQSKYAVVPISAHYGVPFPVAQLLAGLNMRRSHRDMAFPGQDSARIPGVIAFSASFGHDSQILEQRASMLLVPEDVLVDGFVAYREVRVPF